MMEKFHQTAPFFPGLKRLSQKVKMQSSRGGSGEAIIHHPGDGKIVISEKDPWAARGYALYGEVAESLGLTWGGRWKMMDLGHGELRRRGVPGQNS